MKSSKEDLRKRGYVESDDLTPYLHVPTDQLMDMLKDKEATKRTIAATLLSVDKADSLLTRLKQEKSLYTKIAICETLQKGNEQTIALMIPYLGCIGNNQYKNIPSKPSQKKSYPLPRDIIARILSNMDSQYIPLFIEYFNTIDVLSKRELIDAIGYQLFYHPIHATKEVLYKMDQQVKESNDDVLTYKWVTCLSAFKLPETYVVLEQYSKYTQEKKRTLSLLEANMDKKCMY